MNTFATRFLFLAAGAAGTVALGVIAGCNAPAQPQREPPPPLVTVTKSRRMTLPVIVNPIGTTRALQDVTIRARVKGFLMEKHFDEGGKVQKGRLLLVIEEEPYKLKLAEAKAQLAAAEATLKQADASKRREVATAQLALDQAQMLLDRVEEHRTRSLLARKAASQDDYDRADAQLKKGAAQVDADRANLEQAEADYNINIENARAAVAQAKAAVEDAQLNLDYCRMSAPIDGRIGELKVKLGNLVGDGGATELVTIQQLDPMGLDFRPAARYLPVATALLAKGLAVTLNVEGQRAHPHVGKAIFIDNVVDTTTSTFLMRAEVSNPDGSLLPGQYIRAGMIVGEYADAVVVPEQSVMEGQEGSRTFVVDAKHTAQVAKVNAVDVYQGLRVLDSGLEAGQDVIVEGLQLVRPGQVVKPVEVPLDQFIRPEAPATSIDQRFSSRVSRIPGLDLPPSQPKPEAKPGAGGAPTKSGERPAPAPAPNPAPDRRSSPPPETKAR